MNLETRAGAIISAHHHSSDHRSEILASEMCGCFYCKRIYPPFDIREWIDDGGTALCPRCSIDAVVGSASGFPVTDLKFLGAMHRHWF